MSPPPIARDSDIERLREEGFDLEVRSTYLLIKDVPYVTGQREVRRGVLIATLERNESGAPLTHVAYWTGTHPCHSSGAQRAAFCNPSPAQSLGDGIQADHTFSAKAPYRDFHHKAKEQAAAEKAAERARIEAEREAARKAAAEAKERERLEREAAREAEREQARKELEAMKAAAIAIKAKQEADNAAAKKAEEEARARREAALAKARAEQEAKMRARQAASLAILAAEKAAIEAKK